MNNFISQMKTFKKEIHQDIKYLVSDITQSKL